MATEIVSLHDNRERLRQLCWGSIAAGVEQMPAYHLTKFLSAVVADMIESSSSVMVLERVFTSIHRARILCAQNGEILPEGVTIRETNNEGGRA